MLRAVLFDFNGVLVDDEPLHLELLGRVLAEEGLDASQLDLTRHIGRADRDALRDELERAGEEASPDRLSRLIARKAAYYLVRVRVEGFPVISGAGRVVEELAEAGLTLGVVSGALRAEVEGALGQMGVLERFKCLVTSEDVDAGKPNPEGYLRGLTLLNSLPPLPSRLLHPHEVLAVEDSPAGLEAAAAAGFSSLGVAHTFSADELGRADHVIASLDELSMDKLRILFAAS